MLLARAAPDRLAGVFLNDIGPVIAARGIETIRGYLGRPPVARTIPEAVEMRAEAMAAAGVRGRPPLPLARGGRTAPPSRWRRARVELRSRPTPRLPDERAAAGRPLGGVRGAACAARRRCAARTPSCWTGRPSPRCAGAAPDMRAAEVPGRGHVPFLDEPESVALIRAWAAEL